MPTMFSEIAQVILDLSSQLRDAKARIAELEEENIKLKHPKPDDKGSDKKHSAAAGGQ